MKETDWSRYAACSRHRCEAEAGQPCLDLRNWKLHYLDARAMPKAKHPHADRPLRPPESVNHG